MFIYIMYLRDCFGLGSKKAGKAKKQKSKAAKKQKSREAKKHGKKEKTKKQGKATNREAQTEEMQDSPGESTLKELVGAEDKMFSADDPPGRSRSLSPKLVR